MKMFKVKSKIKTIFLGFMALCVVFSMLSGCGMKGPLYQTPEETAEPKNKPENDEKK